MGLCSRPVRTGLRSAQSRRRGPAAAIGAVVFVGSKAYKVVKELGGVWNAAKLLVRAGNFDDFAATAGHAAAGVLGVETIRTKCF